jgi:hypothetical protein
MSREFLGSFAKYFEPGYSKARLITQSYENDEGFIIKKRSAKDG